VLDLEAIVKELGLRDFVLYSGVLSGHVAIHYCIAHPELVRALVLDSGGIDRAMQNAHFFSEALQTSWDAFLQMHASMFEGGAAEARLKWLRSATTYDDYIKTLEASNASNVEPILGSVRTPTLVVAAPTFPATVDAAQRLAAGIPGAQLHLFGGHLNEHLDAKGSEPSQALVTLTNFLKSLPERPPENLAPSSLAGTLSQREVEVLCLMAAGRSNAQIAESLVISPNTVARHVSNIFDKLSVANRAEATAYALRNHLA
jgi:DNA-binding CsgD family transcriptional regulator